MLYGFLPKQLRNVMRMMVVTTYVELVVIVMDPVAFTTHVRFDDEIRIVVY